MPACSNKVAALGQENVRPISGTKTVRIASPPITSRSQRDTPDTGHQDHSDTLKNVLKHKSLVPSSFSPASDLNEAQSINPFEAEVQEEDEDSEDQEMLDNTRQNSSVLTSSYPRGPRRPGDTVLKSTVKREEPSKIGLADADKQRARPTAISRAGSGTARASLDVDAFKRLIMTGEKGVTASGTPPTPPAQNLSAQSILGDSSSNTDTSSISRQSLFEFMAEAATDTPRTSHEISVSDDEWQLPVGASTLASRTFEPQPSSIRYGTSVNISMPRTVSFEDSSSPSFSFENPPHKIDGQGSKVNSQSQIPTDLNKPLPLPPSYKQPEQSTSVQQGRSSPDESSNRLQSISPLSISNKKRPPTPPLARRHSQLRSSNPLLSRSNSARLPRHGISSSAQATDVRTPPPPPTRRTLPVRAQSSSEDSVYTETLLSSSPSAAATIRPEKQHTSRPPPPPARTLSISSIKRPYRPPPAASSVAKVPPPPPPRNRGSSQSSFDGPRIDMLRKPSVTESSSSLGSPSNGRQDEGGSGAAIEKRSQMPNPVSGPNANDILADLSVLQKEVDELRGMYEVRRASE